MLHSGLEGRLSCPPQVTSDMEVSPGTYNTVIKEQQVQSWHVAAIPHPAHPSPIKLIAPGAGRLTQVPNVPGGKTHPWALTMAAVGDELSVCFLNLWERLWKGNRLRCSPSLSVPTHETGLSYGVQALSQ